ncbi:unnamed protein product [Adineta ricciae]|uniref:NmrA-like domain-containing protein n=1 Tax=Adineta ricciae TaxID=249248 RepID=A0A815SQM0_ADIRI|nr:unnamed protein product [Adineta ricciae]CAF1494789.1 unnamed protein product [Adineta ricciae]
MSTNIFKNVLLIGGTGDTGKHILSALLADPVFNVTVLSRHNSTAKFPSNAQVIKVDYSDKNALTKALTGQDVVISAVGGEGIDTNFGITLVEASIDAGVKWLIPSEFGGDYDDPFIDNIPVLASKPAIGKLLKENQSRIAHTFISPGIFLDWSFDNGFTGFDIANHTVTIYDEGKRRQSGTTLPNIAKAVVAILHHPEIALNKRIFIANTTFSQQETLDYFEKETGIKWTVKHASSIETIKNAAEQLAQGKVMDAFVNYIRSAIYGDNKMFLFEGRTNNKELGIPEIPLERIIKEAVQRQKISQ